MQILKYPNVVKFLQQLAVLDTETVSTADDADIIEYSFSIWQQGDDLGNITAKFNTTQEIAPGASAVHFLTNDDLTAYPMMSEDRVVLDTLESGIEYFAGHNVNFDYRMIHNNLERHGYPIPESVHNKDNWIDTLRMAKKMYSQDMSFENLKLSYLWFRLGVNKKVQKKIVPHSAEDDVLMCFHVMMFMLEELIDQGIIDPNGDVGKELVQYCTTPMRYHTMPFGKHKGMTMNEVPLNYLEWMILKSDALDESQVNYDPDFAYTVLEEIQSRAE